MTTNKKIIIKLTPNQSLKVFHGKLISLTKNGIKLYITNTSEGLKAITFYGLVREEYSIISDYEI